MTSGASAANSLSFCILLNARECADAAYAIRLLRVRGERPGGRACKKID
jgi:hypothetical protein